MTVSTIEADFDGDRKLAVPLSDACMSIEAQIYNLKFTLYFEFYYFNF